MCNLMIKITSKRLKEYQKIYSLLSSFTEDHEKTLNILKTYFHIFEFESNRLPELLNKNVAFRIASILKRNSKVFNVLQQKGIIYFCKIICKVIVLIWVYCCDIKNCKFWKKMSSYTYVGKRSFLSHTKITAKIFLHFWLILLHHKKAKLFFQGQKNTRIIRHFFCL